MVLIRRNLLPLFAAFALSSVAGFASATEHSPVVTDFCRRMDDEIRRLGWKLKPCVSHAWKVSGESVMGEPLVYVELSPPGVSTDALNTTLVLSMVHSDEVTPLYVGMKLMEWLEGSPVELQKNRVVIAPLVNPDGFFTRRRTRVNANGVDVNRNFPTADWQEKALKRWRGRYGSAARRFPGFRSGSEPETEFQRRLIDRVRPRKILSIHAPLNFMDYDGPNVLTLKRFPEEYVHRCVELKRRVDAVPGGFFPGSLGNYAGQERGIPTLTLELPSADPVQAHRYWLRFLSGVRTVIHFDVPSVIASQQMPDSTRTTQ